MPWFFFYSNGETVVFVNMLKYKDEVKIGLNIFVILNKIIYNNN